MKKTCRKRGDRDEKKGSVWSLATRLVNSRVSTKFRFEKWHFAKANFTFAKNF